MSEMVLNLAGRPADSRISRHAAGSAESEKSERIRPSGERSERNADEASSEISGEFPRLLDLLIERHNPGLQTDDYARQVQQANQRALANQRITDDDLRVMDDAARGEGTPPDPKNPAGRSGAVVIERAEMGKGSMAFLYRPNSAEVARALQATAERAAGPGADSGKSDPGSKPNGDRGQGPTPSHSNTGTAPEASADGRAPADVVQPKTTSKMPPVFSAALNSAATKRPVAPALAQKAGESKSSPAAARLAKTLATPAAAQPVTRPAGQQGQDTNAGEHGLDSRDAGKQIETTAPKGKAESADGLSSGERRKTVEHVERALLSNLKEGRSVVRLQLSPPHLGKLLIEMKIENSRLSIRFEAENTQVRALLQDSAALLSNLLDEQGVAIDRYEVVLSDKDSDASGFDEALDAHREPTESTGDSSNDRSTATHGEGSAIGEGEETGSESAEERSIPVGKLDVRA